MSKNRFQEFKSQETSLHLFSSPFNTEINSVPEKFQMELLILHIKINSHESFLVDFYRSLSKDEFPQLMEFAKKIVSLFLASTNMNNYFPE
jgi:hypothetical protein